MSFAGRAFAAQQDRRRRRLLVGQLIVGAQQQEPAPGAQRHESNGRRKDADEPAGRRRADVDKPEVPAKAHPTPSYTCASQQRALAMLRRLHPTATVLSGVHAKQRPEPSSGSASGPARPNTAPAMKAIHRPEPAPKPKPNLNRRWRKPLPWAVLPPAPEAADAAPDCADAETDSTDSDDIPIRCLAARSKLATGSKPGIMEVYGNPVFDRTKSHGSGLGSCGSLLRSFDGELDLNDMDLEAQDERLLTDDVSDDGTLDYGEPDVSDPATLYVKRYAKQTEAYQRQQLALEPASVSSTATVATKGAANAAVVPGSPPAFPRTTSTPTAATSKQTPVGAGSASSPARWEADERRSASHLAEFKATLEAVRAISPQLYASQAEHTALASSDEALTSKAMDMLQVEGTLLQRQVEASGAAGGAAAATGLGLEARRESLVSRLETVARQDALRLSTYLFEHSWICAEEAYDDIETFCVSSLRELMLQLRPGPADAASAGAGDLAVAAAAAMAHAWKRLVDAAAVAEIRLLSDQAEAQPAALQVLRSAVLGLVLLEGCTGAEAGPVGLLGPPDPLACAMLGPLMRALQARADARAASDARAGARLHSYLSPGLLYDALAYWPLPYANLTSPSPPLLLGSPSVARLSQQHLSQLLDELSFQPELLLMEAQLGRALAARQTQLAVAIARDLAATRWLRAEARRAMGAVLAPALALPPPPPSRQGTAATAAATAVTVPQHTAVTVPQHTASSGGAGAGQLVASAKFGGKLKVPAVKSLPLYDCLYVPAAQWAGADGGKVSNNEAVRFRDRRLLTLSDAGLLDVKYDSTDVRRLQSALREAAAAQKRLFRPAAELLPQSAHTLKTEQQRQQLRRERSRFERMAAEATKRCHERRRAYVTLQADWRQRNPAQWQELCKLFGKPLEQLRGGMAWRAAIEGLRPGLLAAHPETWGKLVAMAGSSPPNAQELREALHIALLGLIALAGRRVPLPQLRLAHCVMAGARYWSTSSSQHPDRAAPAAVELFTFLTHVPCPWLVLPDPDWTSIECPSAAEAQAMAALPLAHPRRQGYMASLLHHTLERYDMVPELTVALAKWMSEHEVLLQRQGSRRVGALGAGGGSGPTATAAAAEAEGQGAAGELDEETRRELEMLTDDVAVLALKAALERHETYSVGEEDGGSDEDGESSQVSEESSSSGEEEVEKSWGFTGTGQDAAALLNRPFTVPVLAARKTGTAAALAAAAAAAGMGTGPRVGGSAGSGPAGGTAALAEPVRQGACGQQQQEQKQKQQKEAPRPAQGTAPQSAGNRDSIASSSRGGGASDSSNKKNNGSKGARAAARQPGDCPRLAPEATPAQIVDALCHLISCCRWLRGANGVVPTSAPAPASLQLVGPDHMLLTALFLNKGRDESGKDCKLVFEPIASELLAQGAPSRGGQQQVSVLPPQRGEPGTVTLRGVEPAVIPGAPKASAALLVTASSKWSDHWKAAEQAMIKKRIGALTIIGRGAEGVQKALLLAAKVQLGLSQAHGSTVYAGVSHLDWADQEADPEARPEGGGDAWEAMRDVTEWVEMLQEQRERDKAPGSQPRQPAGLGHLELPAAKAVVELQGCLAQGSALRESWRVVFQLFECEPGRPDRPRLQRGGQASEKQQLKRAMFLK